jgi:hypothetical protein
MLVILGEFDNLEKCVVSCLFVLSSFQIRADPTTKINFVDHVLILQQVLDKDPNQEPAS